MKTTEKEINDLVKQIADLTGKANNKAKAIELGHENYFAVDNAACYGGYRLVLIGVNNGAHYGAFDWGSTCPRLKPLVFAEKLQGVITGLEYYKHNLMQ